ncbi:MAG: hypothetical protein FWE53_03815 [Firmicutes bacterium]|nr:hypothetical protein [Bacillota bacterium]
MRPFALSQLGGLFDGVVNTLMAPVNWILDILNGLWSTVQLWTEPGHWANMFYGFIGMIATNFLYVFQAGFFILMDVIQGIFRKIVGLDVYYMRGSDTPISGDIVYSLLLSPQILAVFFAVLGVSIVMLFMATIVAIIRSEWTVQGANPKSKIWGQALKSLFYFAMVPIVCLLGIWISNVILRSLDAATGGGSVTISGQMFYAAAYDSNRARNNPTFSNSLLSAYGGVFVPPSGGFITFTVADMVDDAFRNGVPLDDPTKSTYKEPANRTHVMEYAKGGDPKIHSWMIFSNANVNVQKFDILKPTQVWAFYDLLRYNYMLGFMGGFIACSILLVTVIGVIQRIYELAILFVASPPLVALMPLDNGKKYEKWRAEFIKRVISAYGPILGLNLFFVIAPMLLSINLWPASMPGAGLFNAIVHKLFIITGLVAVKEFSQLISSLVDAQDALKVGEDHKKGVMQLAGRGGAAALTAGKLGMQLGKSWRDGRIDKKARKAGDAAAALSGADQEKARKKAMDNFSWTKFNKDFKEKNGRDATGAEMNDAQKQAGDEAAAAVKQEAYNNAHKARTERGSLSTRAAGRARKAGGAVAGAIGDKLGGGGLGRMMGDLKKGWVDPTSKEGRLLASIGGVTGISRMMNESRQSGGFGSVAFSGHQEQMRTFGIHESSAQQANAHLASNLGANKIGMEWISKNVTGTQNLAEAIKDLKPGEAAKMFNPEALKSVLRSPAVTVEQSQSRAEQNAERTAEGIHAMKTQMADVAAALRELGSKLPPR